MSYVAKKSYNKFISRKIKVDGIPKVLNLKEVIKLFIDHRHDVLIRRTNYELKQAEERAHILEGLKIALENIDKIIDVIKGSKAVSYTHLTLPTNREV